MTATPAGLPFRACHFRKRRQGHCFLRFSHFLIAVVQLLALCSFVSQASAQVVWKGNRSSDWFDNKNWKPNDLPDGQTNATIDGISNGVSRDFPVIVARGAVAANLIVGDSTTSSLTIQAAGTLVAGNITLGNDRRWQRNHHPHGPQCEFDRFWNSHRGSQRDGYSQRFQWLAREL